MSAAEGQDAATDEFYRFLGVYVAIFQWMEGQLDQILLLGGGTEKALWQATQARLAGMKNHDKIEAVRSIVRDDGPYSKNKDSPEWRAEFEKLLARLHGERKRRNEILHSQYLFETVEAGLPPMRSYRAKENGAAVFKREDLGPEKTKAILSELATLSGDLGQARMQLLAWYDEP
jgi:hypothetical protein